MKSTVIFFFTDSFECQKLDAYIWLGTMQLYSVGEGKSLLVMQSVGMVLPSVCVCAALSSSLSPNILIFLNVKAM